MSDSTGARKHTRRSFLDLMMATGLIGWIGSMIYPIVRYLTPLPLAGPTGPVRLTRNEVGTLERERFVIVPMQGKRVLVFQDPEAKLRALDARCTHEGCTVQYVPGESVIWCACHNARFDLEGRVISGPPPRPLPRFTATADGEGGVLVTPEKA